MRGEEGRLPWDMHSASGDRVLTCILIVRRLGCKLDVEVIGWLHC
jgi:hypothetical protein